MKARIITIIALSLTLAVQARATTNLLVYTTHDSGAGSLRQAILLNMQLGGGNTILFSNVVTGTITLTTGELLITNDVTILGPGAAALAVSGNHASRVFHITNATVSVSGLTITNGLATGDYPASAGGGILNERSTLTVSQCTLSRNSATFGAGIFNAGADGGSAMLWAIACTFSGNSAGDAGGGILNDGHNGGYAKLVVDACTFSGNSSAFEGGGIFNEGVVSGSAPATVIACTFTGNSVHNGAGTCIYNYAAALEIGDTILDDQTLNSTVENSVGAVTSDGYNLSSDSGIHNINGGSGSLTALGDQVNTDPMLGPLHDNGGPTPTCLPATDSPAIDQGKAIDGLASDQRGRCRLYDNPTTPNAVGGDGSDIGAVEINPAHGAPLVMTNADGNVVGTLRYCICDGQAGETVTFAPAATGTIALTTGELLIDKNVTIVGPTTAGVTISGNHASGVFHVRAGGALTVSRLTIADGNATTGGGIFNEAGGTLTLSNCTVSGCASVGGGGGISNNGTATVVNCTFYGNQSNGGGGLYNYDGLLNVFNSTVASNRATTAQGGGGVYNYPVAGSLIRVGSSIIAGNSAPDAPDVNGGFVSQGYNLVGRTSGSTGFGATADQLNVNALLGPLADHGGPTFTVALRVGSPAIDKGKSFGLVTDQRGQPRPFVDPSIGNATGGDGSDIGAFELAGGLWSGATDLGNGWKWLDWFGYFNTTYNPWIYHQQHGYLYPVGTDTLFFWDNGMGKWWWTSATTYPYLYRFSDSAWLWYQKDSAGPRWFYNLTAGNWESW